MVFRNTSFGCPACHEELAADAAIAWCKACEGAWVSEAELEERVRIVRGKNEFNLELVFEPGHSWRSSPARRPCPLCRQPLDHTSLGQAEVDRCVQKHGIWFDAGELESVLTAATRGVGVTVPGVKLEPHERVLGESRDPTDPWEGVEDAVDVVTLIVRFVAALFD